MTPAHTPTSQPVLVSRFVTGTITLMSVLIVYDGWQRLRLLDAVAVIVGPVLAMFLSHVFAATLAWQVETGRRATGRERVQMVGAEARFLLIGALPLAVLTVCTLLDVSLTDSIRAVTFMGALSLGYWGGVAGRRAGLTGWRLAMAVLAGLVLGTLVLALQVVLQPGKVASGGTL